MDRAPQRAENVTNQYDDNELHPPDPNAVIPWDEALAAFAAASTYWGTTLRRDGRPHVRPVFGVWVEGTFCTTSSPAAQKGRNLAANPTCSFGTTTDGLDFVLDGAAAPITDPEQLERVATAYRDKYGWPVTVLDGAFDAPFGAPAAGPPPYQPWQVTPTALYAFGTDERNAPRSTRFLF